MCDYCKTDMTGLSVSEFLTSRPKSKSFRVERRCLFRAYLAAQPPGVAPREGKHTLFHEARKLPEVQERRTSEGTFFYGIAAR